MARKLKVRTVEGVPQFRRRGISFTNEPQDVDVSDWSEDEVANLVDANTLYVEEGGKMIGANEGKKPRKVGEKAAEADTGEGQRPGREEFHTPGPPNRIERIPLEDVKQTTLRDTGKPAKEGTPAAAGVARDTKRDAADEPKARTK